MQAVKERVCDQLVLKLLRAGVMEDGQVRRTAAGTLRGQFSAPSCATSTCTGWTGYGTTVMRCWSGSRTIWS
jgi:hypothetical protein